jgi:uncharacterized protein
MQNAGFEWDPVKAAVNVAKHGVSFEEAATVFADQNALHMPDRAEPGRLITIGFSSLARVLFVVYAEVLDGDILRIIHARKASPAQRKRYTNG